MRAEILCVGTELLLGDIVNSNAAYIAKELAAIGVNVYHQAVVGDNAQRLREMCIRDSNKVIRQYSPLLYRYYKGGYFFWLRLDRNFHISHPASFLSDFECCVLS